MENKKNHNITIYSTPTCPYCVMAKEYFKNKEVSFTDLNVAEDQKAVEEMIQKSGQMGVPVIDIDGKVIVGFRPDVFDQLLS